MDGIPNSCEYSRKIYCFYTVIPTRVNNSNFSILTFRYTLSANIGGDINREDTYITVFEYQNKFLQLFIGCLA